MAEISGQCLCGAIKVTVSDPAEWLGVCHCSLCQRWSGGLWAGFPAPADKVRVEGEVTQYASSPIAQRGFCGTCGTQLWMRDVKEGADYDLMPGIFEAAKAWPLHSEIYHDEALKAFDMAGDHRRATAAQYQEKNPDVIGIAGGFDG